MEELMLIVNSQKKQIKIQVKYVNSTRIPINIRSHVKKRDERDKYNQTEREY